MAALEAKDEDIQKGMVPVEEGQDERLEPVRTGAMASAEVGALMARPVADVAVVEPRVVEAPPRELTRVELVHLMRERIAGDETLTPLERATAEAGLRLASGGIGFDEGGGSRGIYVR